MWCGMLRHRSLCQRWLLEAVKWLKHCLHQYYHHHHHHQQQQQQQSIHGSVIPGGNWSSSQRSVSSGSRMSYSVGAWMMMPNVPTRQAAVNIHRNIRSKTIATNCQSCFTCTCIYTVSQQVSRLVYVITSSKLGLSDFQNFFTSAFVKEKTKRLNAVHHRRKRSILGISWKDRITNE